MPFLIVTDPLLIWKEPEPPRENVWGKGSRLYYCGEKDGVPTLEFAIGTAVKFETREAAEIRLLILWLWEPDLIEHGHIVEEETAWAQWHADLKFFERKSGIEDMFDERERRRGCF